MGWTTADLLGHLEQLNEQRVHVGLDHMYAACERLRHPERAIPMVHIAGTNGKGSTGAFMRSLLSAAGYRVGHYTSPHLVDFAERITVGGEPVAYQALAACGEQIADCCADIPLSYFEFATCLAFVCFAQLTCDIAIIEVGLGGRWDATNVICPRVSVLTPIGMDHMAYLGDTLTHIAREKCGVIKAGVPVVSAPQEEGAMQEIHQTCAERQASLYMATPLPAEVPLALPGDHQRINAGVALAAVHVTLRREESSSARALSASEQRALGETRWPGRCEWLSHAPPILFDGAHNVPAARALAAYLHTVRAGCHVTCLLGVMRDKDVVGIVAALRPVVDQFVVVTAPTTRGLPATSLAEIVRAEGGAVQVVDTATHFLRQVFTHPKTQGQMFVVTGSLYLYAPVVEGLRHRGGTT